MSTTERLTLGMNGLQLAWESVSVVVGALLVGLLVGFLMRARASRRAVAAAGSPARQRELESLRRIAAELARTSDVEGVARALLDEIASLFGVGFVALTFVSEDGREASGFLARAAAKDVAWWPDVTLDLVREPSGIASAVFEASSFAVYDATGSTRVSARLARETGAKSAAFIPLISDGRVIAVISVAATDDFRAFSTEDLSVMQTLASEATIALERTRTSIELGAALERERLVASVGRRLRSELDLQAALRPVVEETGRALGAVRCFVRLGAAEMLAEWVAESQQPIENPADLPVSNLALREQRTVTLVDLEEAPELSDPVAGGIENLRSLGARSGIATPVLVQDAVIGVLTVHSDVPHAWVQADTALLEAVAAEVGNAIRIGRLLDENRDRLSQQTALLRAAQVLTGELDLDTVLQRLVHEVAELLQADASDCYLYDPERASLRCAAVHGLDESVVGFEFPATRGLAALAIREGRAMVANEYDELVDPVPNEAYDGFTDAIVAPMRWSDGAQGVLGVGRRTGRPFGPRDADILEAFAGLASLALRNAETFTRGSRQARVQRGFYRIAAVLGQSLSRVATLEAIAQAAAEALGGSSAAVLVSHGSRLTLAGRFELSERFTQLLGEGIEEGDGPLARAAAQSRVIAAPMLVDDERLPKAWRKAAEADGYRALLAVPVSVPHRESGGLVAVLFADERVFTDDDLELARHLADATRGALERSELFEAERSARALAQQLTRTGRLLTTELDPAAVLDEVVQQAPALVNADACAIRVLEDDELVVSAAVGEGADEAVGSRSRASAWLSGDVVQSRAPVAFENAGAEARLRELDPMLLAGNSSYLGVPLSGPDGAPLGVLSVYCIEPRPWREEEIDAMLALAASTSAALSNAELYQRVALEKERSFAILANIADGIVAVDREGMVVLWNEAAAKITGVAAADALGRPPVDVLQRTLESDTDVPVGDRLVSIMRGREEVWLSVTEAVMRDPAGAVAGRIFAFRDISSDRLVEQMKSDFVSTVSHELRTPLTSIYGFAETLLRQDVMFGEPERQTFLGYIASESQKLTGIVDALLNVARLDTGDLQVNIAPTDVRGVVDEVVQSAQDATVDGQQLVVALPPEPLAANADRDKLRQVFSILLDNALKYSRTGGTVTVGVERKDDRVEVSVADEGMGIPQAEQEQIFRKFYRGADADQRVGAGGTGLGLFIARGLVTAMGGRIWVESREGEGSTFAFELPAAGLTQVRQGIGET
ncbi:MAG TPA: GAF domain-containing protein [Gaiellaceae bacterium]|jgi:PAS domain S-box-containing protein|nr:GAF domain-containing protein [Gaiellaceae bacterium]